MKILITGIDGFAGEELTKRIFQKFPSWQIFGIEKNPKINGKKAGIIFYACDITEAKRVNEVIADVRPNYLFHLAGFASASGKDKKIMEKVNVTGTKNILEALKRNKINSRVLLVSSSYVYGNTQKSVKETDRLKPSGIYATSKVKMEKMARNYYKNIDIIVVRPTNHIGLKQRTGFVVPDFVKQIKKIKNNHEIFVGNLSARRDFLDVRDVMDAYLILIRKGKPGQAYNVSTGQVITIGKLLDKIIKISGKKIKIVVDKNKFKPIDIIVNQINPAKLNKLGWSPKIKIDTALKEIYKSI